jgi:hypothetical protein
MNSFNTLLTAAFLTTTLSSIALGDGPFSQQAGAEAPETASTVDAYINAWSQGLGSADLNMDGAVDGSDLELFFHSLQHPISRADINGDGTVNATDFAIFLSDWTSGNERGDLNNDGGIDAGDIEEWYECAGSLKLETAPHSDSGSVDP